MVIEKDVRERVLQTVESMKKEIVQTVSDVVKIQSVNPLYPGIEPESVLGGERECNQFLRNGAATERSKGLWPIPLFSFLSSC